MEKSKGKISILTFSKGDNYGAVLQSYALAEVLRRMGYGVQFFSMPRWYTWRYWLISNISPLKYRFNSFRRKYLRDFAPLCKTEEELTQVAGNSDFCIVGSDQVWNPNITKERTSIYFLGFVPDSTPKISYAASFGTSEWQHPELTEKIDALLKRFKAVSVREDSGVRICRDTFGINPTLVLDPTLLLGDFNALLKRPKYKDYLVGFMFRPTKALYNSMKKFAQDLHTKTIVMDLPSKQIMDRISIDKVSPFTSVEQWVTNIAFAKAVVTDSFHCLCFSLIFKRNFYFINTNSKLSTRITSLLSSLGLEDRIFNGIEEFEKFVDSKDYDKLGDIDYKLVDKKLTDLRDASMAFLKDALAK